MTARRLGALMNDRQNGSRTDSAVGVARLWLAGKAAEAIRSIRL